MQVTSASILAIAVSLVVATFVGVNAAPAEGLTPYGFLMARAFGQPAEHPVMRFIAFKPSDGAKFREAFEKKHGPRGRDLIDSLGRGSYKTAETAVTAAAKNDAGASSKPLAVNGAPQSQSLKQ